MELCDGENWSLCGGERWMKGCDGMVRCQYADDRKTEQLLKRDGTQVDQTALLVSLVPRCVGGRRRTGPGDRRGEVGPDEVLIEELGPARRPAPPWRHRRDEQTLGHLPVISSVARRPALTWRP